MVPENTNSNRQDSILVLFSYSLPREVSRDVSNQKYKILAKKRSVYCSVASLALTSCCHCLVLKQSLLPLLIAVADNGHHRIRPVSGCPLARPCARVVGIIGSVFYLLPASFDSISRCRCRSDPPSVMDVEILDGGAYIAQRVSDAGDGPEAAPLARIADLYTRALWCVRAVQPAWWAGGRQLG